VFFFLAGTLSTVEVFNYPIYMDVRNRQLRQISFCVYFHISMVPGQYDLRSWPAAEKSGANIYTRCMVLAVTGHPAHEAVFIPFRPEGELIQLQGPFSANGKYHAKNSAISRSTTISVFCVVLLAAG
jgi:hypothetical protein